MDKQEFFRQYRNLKTGNTVKQFHGDSKVFEYYSELQSLKNKLTVCPSQLQSFCNHRLESINQVLSETKPQEIEEKGKNYCMEYLKGNEVKGFNECVKSHKFKFVLKIRTEIAKTRNLIERLGIYWWFDCLGNIIYFLN